MSKEYTPSSYYMQKATNQGKPGLYYQPPIQGKDENAKIPPAIWICDVFDVVARSRDGDSNNHGLVLEWRDLDRVLHEWVMPFELLAGDGAEIRKTLMNGGLKISVKKNAKEHLLSYLLDQKPKKKARAVFAIGWQSGGVYVLHNQIFEA